MSQNDTTTDTPADAASPEGDDRTIHNPGNLISPSEAIEKQRQGALLIDVRSAAGRTRNGTVQGAVPVSKEDAPEVLRPDSPRHLVELDGGLDQEVVVFCGSEFGSDPIVDQLKANGYTNIHQIAGGITRWLEEGYPTEGAAEPPTGA